MQGDSMTGVINLYGKFKEQLKEEQSKVAPLQLLGRMEDFFTKEFASLTLVESTGKVLPLTNFGRKADGRRIDMVLVQGDLSQVLDRKSERKLTISALIELKYVRNRHRYGYNSAEDEIATTFKDLSEQLGRMHRRKYADYQVRWGIHLTQVATIGSVAVHGRVGGGLSADTGGTRSSIQQRAGLPGVSVPPALAGRVLLFALPREQSVAAANRPLAMC